MVRVIADYIEQSRHLVMMAPTGRAARVLAMKTGHAAVTIHKAIYTKAHVEPKKSKMSQSQSLSSYFLSTNLKMEAILLLLWMRHQWFVLVKSNMNCLCTAQTI